MNNFNPYLETRVDDLPIIVLTTTATDLIGYLIKWKTDGSYSHAMFLTSTSGDVVSQQFDGYKKMKIDSWMKPNGRVKFWKFKGTEEMKKACVESIYQKLCHPKKKRYDWIGIFGQLLGFKKLNHPQLNYCSEDVAYHLRVSARVCNSDDVINILDGIDLQSSPADLNEYFKRHPELFQVVGVWDGDLE